MPDITEPELNEKEEWTRDYILPLLPSRFDEPAEAGEEQIKTIRSILAKQYVEHAKLDIFWRPFVVLLVYDVCFRLNSVVYGLFISVLDSLALALSNLYTPELLAKEVFHEPRDLRSKIESKAERSVKANVGVAGLAVGFIWQIFTISGPIPSELLSQNYLQEVFPNWIGFAVTLTLGYVILGDVILDLCDQLKS